LNLKPEGRKIIPHVCNDVNKFGAGFALGIAEKWPKVKEEFHSKAGLFELGDVQFVPVLHGEDYGNGMIVANMIAQHGVRSADNVRPLNYQALGKCLSKVNEMAVAIGATIHTVKIGSGLSGGDWSIIEEIIKETIDVDVFIYEL
jgi:hypothetical protein